MPYRIRLTRLARLAVRRLPGNLRQRARRMIDGLANEPRPTNAKELRDEPGLYRMRLDGWRIIYQVDDETQGVFVLTIRRKVGPETYKNIERYT
ncbi:MAG TPA: type II toxin-antitoxin system RelE/ParE family toxin [Anaerolineales bacterium]|nr:MAG: hypothetical protein A2Z04_04275 [Chloroflexi bacterium RBG_16_57_9]HJW89025.1 type II toxin-antitoxin system RelE/ParE family toxin [Anaerolineales bacterium]